MKTTLLPALRFCLLNLIALTTAYSQACTFTNLRLNSQADVNAFNSSCKTINGNVTISGTDIISLSPLANIETFNGVLTIQNNSSLTTLTGLEKMTSAKNLLILNNSLLTDLSGLEGLTSAGTTLRISSHTNLVSLKGLNNLTTAGSIYISGNDLLPNLTGLGNLESVSDLLSISSNKKLASLTGLSKLSSVARISIGENEILPNLSGLGALTSVSWQMNISSNKSMVSFNGLDNLTYLSELYISDNNLMKDLSGLETVSGMYWLVVGESKGLTSLNGLNNLLTVTNFIIRTNPLLTDLSGLENLTNIGWFSVSDNAELTSFSGLGESGEGQRIGANKRVAALQIGGLSITNNPKLATCAIPAVCDFVNTNSATISGNAPGCESQAAVQTACRSLPVTLTYFKVSAENQTAVLQWATAEEKNSSSFEIEHSKDSKTWKKVGEKVATGESNKPIEYHFVHSVSESGLHYYRLKMLDSDHTFSYSKIQSVKFSGSDENSLFLYPNPATDEFFVGKKADLIKIRIVDMQGKMVYETHNIPSAGLSVKKLAAGTYQVHMTKMNGVTQTERIVIF